MRSQNIRKMSRAAKHGEAAQLGAFFKSPRSGAVGVIVHTSLDYADINTSSCCRPRLVNRILVLA
jgi:hypothetical protein